MKSCIKKISGIIFILILGFVSCKVEVEVTDTTAPGSVTNLTATVEKGKIILTWEDPSDNDLLGIKVYNGEEETARVVSLEDGILIGKGIQKCEISNLENEKTYTFKVSAVDKSLNESTIETTEPVVFKVLAGEKVIPVYKFICPKDRKEYSTAQEAADCCGVQIEYVDKEVEKIVKKYVCPRDGKEYDTAEEAEECCGPIVNTVTKFVCPKDKKEYATAEEATNCCGVQKVEKEITVYKYICPKDRKEYSTAQEAADCCGVQIEYVDKEVEKIVKKYVCPRDGKEYDTAEEAEECCGPVVNTVTEYVCPKDKKEYATAEDAANCCGVQTVEKEVTVYKYVCPKDKKEFATAQEAADCCGVQIEYVDKEVEKIVKKYVCPSDGKEYDTAEEAENCCGPVVEEKLVYTTAVKAGTYTVYHFQQNINGGKTFADYTLVNTENGKILAENTTLEDLKETYAGFTPKALAQNENVIYVFYDRNIITYTFQTGSEGQFSDGTIEKVIKGLYGTSFSSPIVTSSTHSFDGWFTISNTAPGSFYGEEDLTFKVRWAPKWYEIPVDAETGNIATASSKYIYFGMYPKSVLPQDSVINIDETEIEIMGANTYYKGNDGYYYIKVSVNSYVSGDIYYKFLDGTEVTGIRYFKVEPIKWKVLTNSYNGKSLLLAEEILTANIPYCVLWSANTHRTIDGNIVHHNNYKYSTIRAYLNGVYEIGDEQSKTYEGKGFLQTAFTSNAQLLIADTEVDNSAETTDYNESNYAIKYVCENTTDKIFLLSESEVINNEYGFDRPDLSVANRMRETTDYAKANYASYACNWWLRSPFYYYNNTARCVSKEGIAFSTNYVNDSSCGVVPALCLSLD